MNIRTGVCVWLVGGLVGVSCANGVEMGLPPEDDAGTADPDASVPRDAQSDVADSGTDSFVDGGGGLGGEGGASGASGEGGAGGSSGSAGDGGAGGSSGSGGDAGTGGAGGSSGSGGNAGTGGVGGAGGDAGTGGAGGAGGDAGTGGVGGSSGSGGAGAAGSSGASGSSGAGGSAGSAGSAGTAGSGGASGSSGSAGSSGSGGSGGDCHIVINEIVTAVTESASNEWIELHNPCSEAVDLASWQMFYRSAAGTTDVKMYTWVSGSLAAHGYFLLGGTTYSGSVAADAKVTNGAMSATGGGLQLRDSSGTAVDSVGWGTATNSFIEGSVAPAPDTVSLPGHSLARTSNGVDTDSNSADFSVCLNPTPRAAN